MYRSSFFDVQVIIAYPVVSTVAINDTIITSTHFHPYFPIIVVSSMLQQNQALFVSSQCRVRSRQVEVGRGESLICVRVESMTSHIVITQGKSALLHINYVPIQYLASQVKMSSCILIQCHTAYQLCAQSVSSQLGKNAFLHTN